MNRIAFALLAMAFSAAFAAPIKTKPVQESASQKRLNAAREQVLDTLKDPESARFKEIYVAVDGETVCGAVNSKNSMGGYVGFQNFMVDPSGRLFFDDSGPSFPGLIVMACKK